MPALIATTSEEFKRPRRSLVAGLHPRGGMEVVTHRNSNAILQQVTYGMISGSVGTMVGHVAHTTTADAVIQTLEHFESRAA